MVPTWPRLSQPQGWGCPFCLLTCPELWAGHRHSTSIPAQSSQKLSLCCAFGLWAPRVLWVLGDDTVIPQRCCPARGKLRAIAESVETQPLLRVSLAILTIGSLLVIAVVNLVGAGAGAGGPGQDPLG